MKKLLLILLVLSLGCKQEKAINDQYSVGIPIEHANEYKTTRQSFGSFFLHSWMHDTLYQYSGNELQIEPVDSSLIFEAFAEGAQLLKNSKNRYKFILEPTDTIVNLILIVNNKDTVNKEFKAQVLPPPLLVKETIGDSLQLTLIQEENRLRRILPMDTRYGFNTEKGGSEKLMTTKMQFKLNELEAIRLNYRNIIYPAEIKK